MAFFRKKPIVIEAVEWKGYNLSNVAEFLGKESNTFIGDGNSNFRIEHESDKWIDDKIDKFSLVIKTLEGEMVASVGDWIIKGVNGEFYPCKPDIFNKTYDFIG